MLGAEHRSFLLALMIDEVDERVEVCHFKSLMIRSLRRRLGDFDSAVAVAFVVCFVNDAVVGG